MRISRSWIVLHTVVASQASHRKNESGDAKVFSMAMAKEWSLVAAECEPEISDVLVHSILQAASLNIFTVGRTDECMSARWKNNIGAVTIAGGDYSGTV